MASGAFTVTIDTAPLQAILTQLEARMAALAASTVAETRTPAGLAAAALVISGSGQPLSRRNFLGVIGRRRDG